MSTHVTRREALRAAALAPLVLGAQMASAAGNSVVSAAGRRAHGGPEVAFHNLLPGTRVGRCRIVRVSPVVEGGVPVELAAPNGRTFHVDVLRHDAATPGVARAGSLAVYVRNGGKGETATDEEQGLGAIALAALLAHREADGRPVPRLLTLREREPRLAAIR